MSLPPQPHPHLAPWLAAVLRALFWLATLTVALAVWEFATGAELPYNSEGRYFDPTEGVVYHQQTVEFWAVVLVVAAIAAVGSLWWLKKPPSSRFLP